MCCDPCCIKAKFLECPTVGHCLLQAILPFQLIFKVLLIVCHSCQNCCTAATTVCCCTAAMVIVAELMIIALVGNRVLLLDLTPPQQEDPAPLQVWEQRPIIITPSMWGLPDRVGSTLQNYYYPALAAVNPSPRPLLHQTCYRLH